MTKPTNAVEREFYRWLYPHPPPALPQGANVAMQAGIAALVGHVPGAHVALRAFLPIYYGEDTAGSVVLENLADGLQGARFLDVKIGARTCSEDELIAQGRSESSAWVKKKKLEFADWATLSEERGFRVVASAGYPGDDRKTLARRDPNLVFNTFFGPGPGVPQGAGPVPGGMRQQVATQIEQIRTGVNWCDYSMIAASVLVVLGWDAAAMPGAWVARTRVIDFAHSYHHQRLGNWSAAQFRKYSRNFSEGLASLSIAMCTYP